MKIHYVTIGEGPLVVMVHGFPDYWYTWRNQMEVLSENFRVAAMDLRGYNLSDAPEGRNHYRMPRLVSDIAAVVRDCGEEKAILVGHDWGAAISWRFAMGHPEMVEKLVILSVPHPSGFNRELATNEKQRADSQYARDFQAEDSHESLTAEGLAGWVGGGARARYVEAFRRSNLNSMMEYYRANYPRVTPGVEPKTTAASFPRIPCPVLVIHGLDDTALNARGHAYSWEWIDGDTTLVMIPDAGHFVQHDASELVSKTMAGWLLR